jgi:hypothetical protein
MFEKMDLPGKVPSFKLNNVGNCGEKPSNPFKEESDS